MYISNYVSSSSSASATAKGGVGFCGLLTIALVVLRACDVIHCSWIVCFLPVIIPVVLVGIVIGFFAWLAHKLNA